MSLNYHVNTIKKACNQQELTGWKKEITNLPGVSIICVFDFFRGNYNDIIIKVNNNEIIDQIKNLPFVSTVRPDCKGIFLNTSS